jgi:uncharacterized membrane protein YfcA
MIRTSAGFAIRRSKTWHTYRNRNDLRAPTTVTNTGSSCCPCNSACRGIMFPIPTMRCYNKKFSKDGMNNASRPYASQPSPSSPTGVDRITTSMKSFAIGSLAGCLGSLAGMGGGFVMIPLMTSRSILTVPLTQHQAHGTSLFAVAATGLAAAITYGSTSRYNNKNSSDDVTNDAATNVVRVPEAMAIACTAIVTARWGAQATLHFSGSSLKRALGYLMLLMAPAVPAKSYYMQYINDNSNTPVTSHSNVADFNWDRLLYPTIIGVGSGFLSGIFGVGGLS